MTNSNGEVVRSESLENGRVLRIVIDAGKGNVIDTRVIAEMRAVLESSCRSASLCAVILDHAGKHFSFGASVEEHVPGKVEDMLPSFHALAREFLDVRVPLVAVVRGMCLGGGLEVATLADRIFASPDAKLGQPEVVLGVFAPIGSALLPHRIPQHHAVDLLLTGRTVGAEEALAMGLVAEITDDPGEAALEWVREHLLPKSGASLRFAIDAARLKWREAFLDALDRLEDIYLRELMSTRDAPEGIRAFLEKRKPVWEDC